MNAQGRKPSPEALFHIGVKALIRNARSQYLVIQSSRRDGSVYWDLPGGRILRGETPLAALAREVKEETGLSINIKRPLLMAPSNVELSLDSGQTVGLYWDVYLCTASNDIEHPTQDGHKWCSSIEASELLATDPGNPSQVVRAVAEIS